MKASREAGVAHLSSIALSAVIGTRALAKEL
jgi:hypothetical protein